MKFKISVVVAFMLLINVGIAHETETKMTIGMLEIPDIQEPLWHELRAHGGTRDYGDTGVVSLYRNPDAASEEALWLYDFRQLAATSLIYEGVNLAYVFDRTPNWFQIKTDESQYLWIKREDTVNFQLYSQILHGRRISIHERPLKIYSKPDLRSELVEVPDSLKNESWYNVRSMREVDGMLWVLIGHVWSECQYGMNGLKKSDSLFKSRGWIPAHNVHGINSFGLVTIC